jgi:hypothetical protein
MSAAHASSTFRAVINFDSVADSVFLGIIASIFANRALPRSVLAFNCRFKARDRYRCKVAMGGHVMREAAPIDEFVEGVILRRLSEPDVAEALSTSPRVA